MDQINSEDCHELMKEHGQVYLQKNADGGWSCEFRQSSQREYICVMINHETLSGAIIACYQRVHKLIDIEE